MESKETYSEKLKNHPIYVFITTFVVAAGIGYTVTTAIAVKPLEKELEQLKAEISARNPNDFKVMEQELAEAKESLAIAESELILLREKSSDFNSQIEKLSGHIGMLEKENKSFEIKLSRVSELNRLMNEFDELNYSDFLNEYPSDCPQMTKYRKGMVLIERILITATLIGREDIATSYKRQYLEGFSSIHSQCPKAVNEFM